MGLNTSQLRKRQQVQDSSVTTTTTAAADALVAANDNNALAKPDDIKAHGGDVFSSNNNGSDININHNSNNNNNIDVDVAQIKNALHSIGKQILENGNSDCLTQQQQLNEAQLQDSNDSSQTAATKTSTLQRQTSHIQSLAQRIRRSSSLRAPRFKGLIPSFMNGRRKVS